MVYELHNDSSLTKARESKTHLHMQNIFSDTVTWDESFEYMTEVVEEDSPVRIGKFFTIITHTAHHHIDKVKAICNQIQQLKNRNANIDIADAHMYMGLTAKSESIGKHHDDCEVIFWQCIGQTEWTVDDNSTYILSPGDCLYIPKGMMHEVKSLSPRMGISFGF